MIELGETGLNIFYAIILGLIQGLAEFLPVSSSGHLVLFSNLFGLESPEESNLFFDVLVHFGTLVAVCIAYRKDIAEMVREFFALIRDSFSGKRGCGPRKPEKGNVHISDRERLRSAPPARRLIFMLILATLPLLLILPVKDYIEGMRNRPILVGAALILTGVILFFADRASKGRKTERSATWLDALFVGVCQAAAVVPGLSRSGTTIAGGLFSGFDRKFAIRFSFLMSIPTVLAATLLTLIDALKAGIDMSMVPVYLTGMVAAGVSGFFAIRLLSYLTSKGKFGGFAWYCWAAGLITIIAVTVI